MFNKRKTPQTGKPAKKATMLPPPTPPTPTPPGKKPRPRKSPVEVTIPKKPTKLMLMNPKKDKLKKVGSFPAICSHKSGMYELVRICESHASSVPKYNLNVEDAGTAFMLALYKNISVWKEGELNQFFEYCTGRSIVDYHHWEEKINMVKRLLAELFYVDESNCKAWILTPAVYKMWPGGINHNTEKEYEMTAKEEGKKGFGKKVAGKKAKFEKDTVVAPVAKGKPEKAAKAGKPEKAKKPLKAAKGDNGQFTPLGTVDWDKVPDDLKVVRGEEATGPVARIKAYGLLPTKGATTVGKWLEQVAKTLKVKESKARNICWPLLNRRHAKKA